MSVDKCAMTPNSAIRCANGIFTLSNIFHNHSSHSANRISFEPRLVDSPRPPPFISAFKQPTSRAPRRRTAAQHLIELEAVALEDGETGAAPPDFDSEFERVSLSADAPPALRFMAAEFSGVSGKVVLLKNLLRVGDSFSESQSAKPKKRYVCKYCGDAFVSGCAMGGHISKVHRGCSTEYRRKRLKSKDKKSERERARFLRGVLKPKSKASAAIRS